MLTRTTITESEKIELRNALHKFRQAEVDKEEAVNVIADVLGCHVDEAWTAGERREGMERILDRYGIEVAPDDEPPATTVQDQLELAWMVVCGGGFWVVVCVCIWMFFGEGGEE